MKESAEKDTQEDELEPIHELEELEELEAEPLDDESELDTLARERAEYLAHWQRAQADYQNLKRRQAGEVEGAVRRALSPLLEDVLLVLDHLDMALASPATVEETKNLALGVGMTRDQLIASLERSGVVPIATEGEFDPELHQAIATVESADAEPGTILDVQRSGWMHQGRVLRYAQVRVATAPDADADSDSDA